MGPHSGRRFFGNRHNGRRGLRVHGGQFALRRNVNRLTRVDKNAPLPLQGKHAYAAADTRYKERTIRRRLNVGRGLLALRYRYHDGVAGAQIHARRSMQRGHHHPAQLQLSVILRFDGEDNFSIGIDLERALSRPGKSCAARSAASKDVASENCRFRRRRGVPRQRASSSR